MLDLLIDCNNMLTLTALIFIVLTLMMSLKKHEFPTRRRWTAKCQLPRRKQKSCCTADRESGRARGPSSREPSSFSSKPWRRSSRSGLRRNVKWTQELTGSSREWQKCLKTHQKTRNAVSPGSSNTLATNNHLLLTAPPCGASTLCNLCVLCIFVAHVVINLTKEKSIFSNILFL